VTVLCYHEVDEDWASPLAVRPADFAAQATWLARHRRVVGTSEAFGRLDRSWRLPRGEVAMTFDDGFAGIYRHALPVLRRLRLPATVYVVTRMLHGTPDPIDWVRESHPMSGLRCLTADEVLEMRDSGIRFGSHTVSHRDLPTLSFREQLSELRESREALEDLLRERVDSVAYPRGLHDEVTREASRRAGYDYALALPEQHEHRGAQAVPRVGIYRGNDLRALRIKTSRAYLPLRLRLGAPGLRARLRRSPSSAVC
jgi:peptidoglycan/xylan/chitin deacetylase (PgdA/CDA1 family)